MLRKILTTTITSLATVATLSVGSVVAYANSQPGYANFPIPIPLMDNTETNSSANGNTNNSQQKGVTSSSPKVDPSKVNVQVTPTWAGDSLATPYFGLNLQTCFYTFNWEKFADSVRRNPNSPANPYDAQGCVREEGLITNGERTIDPATTGDVKSVTYTLYAPKVHKEFYRDFDSLQATDTTGKVSKANVEVFKDLPVLGIFPNRGFPAQSLNTYRILSNTLLQSGTNVNRGIIDNLNSIYTNEELSRIYGAQTQRTGAPRLVFTGPDDITEGVRAKEALNTACKTPENSVVIGDKPCVKISNYQIKSLNEFSFTYTSEFSQYPVTPAVAQDRIQAVVNDRLQVTVNGNTVTVKPKSGQENFRSTYAGGFCIPEAGKMKVRTSILTYTGLDIRLNGLLDPNDPIVACRWVYPDGSQSRIVLDRHMEAYQFVYIINYPTAAQCRDLFGIPENQYERNCLQFYRDRIGQTYTGNNTGSRVVYTYTYYGMWSDANTYPYRWGPNGDWKNPDVGGPRSKFVSNATEQELLRFYPGAVYDTYKCRENNNAFGICRQRTPEEIVNYINSSSATQSEKTTYAALINRLRGSYQGYVRGADGFSIYVL